MSSSNNEFIHNLVNKSSELTENYFSAPKFTSNAKAGESSFGHFISYIRKENILPALKTLSFLGVLAPLTMGLLHGTTKVANQVIHAKTIQANEAALAELKTKLEIHETKFEQNPTPAEAKNLVLKSKQLIGEFTKIQTQIKTSQLVLTELINEHIGTKMILDDVQTKIGSLNRGMNKLYQAIYAEDKKALTRLTNEIQAHKTEIEQNTDPNKEKELSQKSEDLHTALNQIQANVKTSQSEINKKESISEGLLKEIDSQIQILNEIPSVKEIITTQIIEKNLNDFSDLKLNIAQHKTAITDSTDPVDTKKLFEKSKILLNTLHQIQTNITTSMQELSTAKNHKVGTDHILEDVKKEIQNLNDAVNSKIIDESFKNFAELTLEITQNKANIDSSINPEDTKKLFEKSKILLTTLHQLQNTITTSMQGLSQEANEALSSQALLKGVKKEIQALNKVVNSKTIQENQTKFGKLKAEIENHKKEIENNPSPANMKKFFKESETISRNLRLIRSSTQASTKELNAEINETLNSEAFLKDVEKEIQTLNKLVNTKKINENLKDFSELKIQILNHKTALLNPGGNRSLLEKGSRKLLYDLKEIHTNIATSTRELSLEKNNKIGAVEILNDIEQQIQDLTDAVHVKHIKENHEDLQLLKSTLAKHVTEIKNDTTPENKKELLQKFQEFLKDLGQIQNSVKKSAVNLNQKPHDIDPQAVLDEIESEIQTLNIAIYAKDGDRLADITTQMEKHIAEIASNTSKESDLLEKSQDLLTHLDQIKSSIKESMAALYPNESVEGQSLLEGINDQMLNLLDKHHKEAQTLTAFIYTKDAEALGRLQSEITDHIAEIESNTLPKKEAELLEKSQQHLSNLVKIKNNIQELNVVIPSIHSQVLLDEVNEQIQTLLHKHDTVETSQDPDISSAMNYAKKDVALVHEYSKAESSQKAYLAINPVIPEDKGNQESSYVLPHQFYMDLKRSTNTAFNGEVLYQNMDYFLPPSAEKEAVKQIDIAFQSAIANVHKTFYEALGGEVIDTLTVKNKSLQDEVLSYQTDGSVLTNAMFTVMNLGTQGVIASNVTKIKTTQTEQHQIPITPSGSLPSRQPNGMGLRQDFRVEGDKVHITLKCGYTLLLEEDMENSRGDPLRFQFAKREITLSLKELQEVTPENGDTLKTIHIKDTYSPVLTTDHKQTVELYEIF